MKEISAESFKAIKETIKEVEISNRQFEAARVVRLTTESKAATTDEWRLEFYVLELFAKILT